MHVINPAEDRAVDPEILPVELSHVSTEDDPAEGEVDPIAVERVLHRSLDDGLGLTGPQGTPVHQPGAENNGTETTHAVCCVANHVFHVSDKKS